MTKLREEELEEFRDKCFSLHFSKEDIALFNLFFEELRKKIRKNRFPTTPFI